MAHRGRIFMLARSQLKRPIRGRIDERNFTHGCVCDENNISLPIDGGVHRRFVSAWANFLPPFPQMLEELIAGL